MRKEITITEEQFSKICVDVIKSGEYVKILKAVNEQAYTSLPLLMAPIFKDLKDQLFHKGEVKNNG